MKRYLILEDGQVFEGEAIGYDKVTTGELVFTTGMGGYIETLTDPSYYGQIVIQTFPLIGNYGMIDADKESDRPYLSGYVVSELIDTPSNFRCNGTLNDFLIENKIPGIKNVDTRLLTTLIREKGVMNARLTNDINDSKDIKEFVIKDALKNVSSVDIEKYFVDDAKYTVCLMDFGAKMNIIRELNKRECNVISVPYNMKAKDILDLNIDGIMLSNGPGDPSENIDVINELKELIGKKPIFGICLGHQLLALAHNGRTAKLKYGHRGVNQPVLAKDLNRTFVTSQNHGYAVLEESIDKGVGYVNYVNANDFTCEGVKYPLESAFTVQFHPEASSGPLDTKFLFDDFIALMEVK